MKTKHKQIEVGDIFPTSEGGSVTIVEYRGAFEVVVKHNDEYGHVAVVEASNLRNGMVKNPYHRSAFGVGFMGAGGYISKVDGKNTPAYDTWRNMLRRCYDPKYHARFPTYIGCTVHSDWHNYQNFAVWHERQYWAEGWELDKDLIVEGNKIYSADTCVFVPSQLNSLLIDCGANRGDLPLGVTGLGKGYKAQLSIDGKRHSLGVYATPEEAFHAYKFAKETNVKRMVEKYKDLIDPRVYDSLMHHEVVSEQGEGDA